MANTFDPQAELQNLYSAKKQTSQSLLDRLNSIDSYAATVNPKRFDTLSGIGRAEGESPLNTILSALRIGEDTSRSRSNALSDLVSNQNSQENILKTILSSQNADEQLSLDKLKLFKDLGVGVTGNDPVVEGYVDQLKNGSIKLNGVPAESRDAVVKYLKDNNVNLKAIEEEGKNKKFKDIVDMLKEIYYGDVQNQKDDLSYGRAGSVWNDIMNKFTGNVSNGRLTRYNNIRNATVAQFKQLFGETGVLTDRDIGRLLNALPSTNLTNNEAQGAWNDIYSLIGGDSSKTNKDGSLTIGKYSVVQE